MCLVIIGIWWFQQSVGKIFIFFSPLAVWALDIWRNSGIKSAFVRVNRRETQSFSLHISVPFPFSPSLLRESRIYRWQLFSCPWTSPPTSAHPSRGSQELKTTHSTNNRKLCKCRNLFLLCQSSFAAAHLTSLDQKQAQIYPATGVWSLSCSPHWIELLALIWWLLLWSSVLDLAPSSGENRDRQS